MWRFLFPFVVLSALFVCVPLMSNPTSTSGSTTDSLPTLRRTLDVEPLLARTRNAVLRSATADERAQLGRQSVGELARQVNAGSDRERSLAIAVLGVSGEAQAVPVLAAAYESETHPVRLRQLAIALAECGDPEGFETLVYSIRQGQGLAAYEACRALQGIHGVNLGMDANAWDRWYQATHER